MTRVAIVALSDRNTRGVANLTKAVVAGLESQGCQVEIIRGAQESLRFSQFGYICFISEGAGALSSKISPLVQQVLSQAIGLAGKRGCAILLKKLWFAEPTLVSFMDLLEAQGVVIRNSFITAEPASAKSFASTIDVQPNKPAT